MFLFFGLLLDSFVVDLAQNKVKLQFTKCINLKMVFFKVLVY